MNDGELFQLQHGVGELGIVIVMCIEGLYVVTATYVLAGNSSFKTSRINIRTDNTSQMSIPEINLQCYATPARW